MRSSQLMATELVRFMAWALVVVPFITATVFSPLQFLSTLENAALHAAGSGDIIVGWVSHAYDFVAPIHTIFRTSIQHQARRQRVPAGRIGRRGQKRR